jgi:hypothetical protein
MKFLLLSAAFILVGCQAQPVRQPVAQAQQVEAPKPFDPIANGATPVEDFKPEAYGATQVTVVVQQAPITPTLAQAGSLPDASILPGYQPPTVQKAAVTACKDQQVWMQVPGENPVPVTVTCP